MTDAIDLEAIRDLLVSASGIEAAYGRNPYVDYLRAHKRYPPPNVAITIAAIIGGRCRADDGKLYPRPARRRRPRPARP